LLRQLDELAAEVERKRIAAERRERAEGERAEREHAEHERAVLKAPPQPTAPPPRRWPSQAEVDGFVDRLMADPDAPVTAELWERFAAHEQSRGARERAMGAATALVADAWRDRLAR
jgi:hypothetical protein